MKLTILTENTANKRGMLAEHGLSLLIEANGKRILFDTGQSDIYLKNAQQCDISLQELDAVVLSHGHYDHCGGLEALPKKIAAQRKGGPLPVYVGRGAFLPRFYEQDSAAGKSCREIGIPWQRQALEQTGKAEDTLTFCETEGLREIFRDIFLLGQIPQNSDFEGVDPGFFLEGPRGKERDLMLDEQLLLIREKGRLHVIAGCCHVGVISCLQQVRRFFPEERLGLLLAGMHLRSADEKRINATIAALREFDPECLMPVHCTGMMAMAAMKLAFGRQCRLGEAGKHWEG